jgi:hypothetical protein
MCFYTNPQTYDGKYQLTVVYMRLQKVSNVETLQDRVCPFIEK